MNTARLARRLQEAKGDLVVMAEAIGDEFDDPVHGYVTREMFDARMDALLAEMRALEARMEALASALRAEMAALRGETNNVRAEMVALEARIEKRLAEMEARLMRAVVVTQVAGFMAVIVAIVFK